MRETILRRRDDRMKTVYPLSPNMNIMKRKIIDDEEEEDKSPITTQNQCGNRRMRRERERERERTQLCRPFPRQSTTISYIMGK